MKYSSNDKHIIIGKNESLDYTDIINYIKNTNSNFISELESFISSNDDRKEDIIKDILNVTGFYPGKLIEYYNNKQLLLLSTQRRLLMSINENMFLEPYMKLYNNGEKIFIFYKNNPIKDHINNYSILAMVIIKDTYKKPFDNVNDFSLYIKENIKKIRYIRKQKAYREHNTKLVFSKLYDIDLISAEKEMLFSLGIEPFDEYEDKIFSKIKEIIKSNTDAAIDKLWLTMSIINHSNIEETINRLPYIIEEINKDNMFKK